MSQAWKWFEQSISDHIAIMGLMFRSYVQDVPDGETCAEYHQSNKRICVSCKQEFFGAPTRIECRECATPHGDQT